jgi:hypothetical protein
LLPEKNGENKNIRLEESLWLRREKLAVGASMGGVA